MGDGNFMSDGVIVSFSVGYAARTIGLVSFGADDVDVTSVVNCAVDVASVDGIAVDVDSVSFVDVGPVDGSSSDSSLSNVKFKSTEFS